MQRNFLTGILALLSGIILTPEIAVSKSFAAGNKGLFIVQLSWETYTYSDDVTITLNYEKNTTLNKIRSANETIKGIKNQFLIAELNEGEYEFLSIDLTGGNIPYGKRLNIRVDKTFNIEAGKVTNGGLLFLTRESSNSDQVMILPVDNTTDVNRYVKTFRSSYSDNLTAVNTVLTFLEKEKTDKLIRNYAEILLKAENANPRPKVTYMYTVLGMLMKVDRDKSGKVIRYELLPTHTYQQITRVDFRGDKLLCTLGNGDYIFGQDSNMDYVPLPKDIEGHHPLYLFGTNQFMMIDNKLNIFTADETFSWKPHSQFRRDNALTFPPKVYSGPKNLYVYSTGFGKERVILRSAYDNVSFHPVELSDEIKEVDMVTETPSMVIIGPDTRGSVKKPALLYVKNHDQDIWQVVELPRGDCNRFAPDKNDENHFYVECSLDRIRYQSLDGGKTWNKGN